MVGKIFKIKWLVISLFVGAVFSVLFTFPETSKAVSQEPYKLKIPLGLDEEAFKVPQDNPMTREKIELGRLLFFDNRLSANNTIACASCHIPELAFTDGQSVSSGIHHLQGGRSAPTAINRGFSEAQFWDGRAPMLEDQSIGPFANPIEHGFSNHDELVSKISMFDGYKKMFKNVFGTDNIKKEHVGKAIASFQRTLISGNSPFD